MINSLKLSKIVLKNYSNVIKKVIPSSIKKTEENSAITNTTKGKTSIFRKCLENFYLRLLNLQKESKFSKNNDVAIIEKNLSQMGVFGRFGNDLELAKLVEGALKKVKNAGFEELPKTINLIPKTSVNMVYKLSGEKEKESPIFIIKNYVKKRKEEIVINKNCLKEQGIRYTSTDDLDGIILHEIGHWLHKAPAESTCERIWKTANQKKIVPEVSFSITKDKMGKEFVAEVFSGLMSGKKYSTYTMDLYQKLNGPMPKNLREDSRFHVLNKIN